MCKLLARLAFCILSLATCQPALAQSEVVAPKVAVAGKSQAEWSAQWWQWAASFRRSESPVADKTGERCASGQSGPVWFLAGTYGTSRTVRSCHVPAGKYVFLPLINYVVTSGEGVSCAGVRAEAKRITNNPEGLIFDLDGHRLKAPDTHRQETSDCFDVAARSGTPGMGALPAAANGYYVMLEPLAPGKHTLNFGGILPGMAQAVTYELTVE